jgi:predicted outer membrane protein
VTRVITKENSPFVGSDGEARHWSIAKTLTQTAKQSGFEAVTWLSNALAPIVPGRTKAHELQKRRRGLAWCLALAGCLLAGKVIAGGPSPADRAFLGWDAQIEIQQQDMGHLAERRGQSTAVRDLGTYLVARHTETQQRLRQLAVALGVTLSDHLSEVHLRVQRHYAAIPETEFDRGFIHHEIGDYQYFLRYFDAARTSTDPMIRAFAAEQVPRLQEDQAKIEQLQNQLGRI